MPLPHEPIYPSGWIKGALLDVRRYTDRTFKIGLLDAPKDAESLNFDCVEECQAFVSWWYMPEVRA